MSGSPDMLGRLYNVWLAVLMSLVCGCAAITEYLQIDDDVAPIDTVPADSNILRFVAMGDTGSGDPEQFDVARAVRNYCQNNGCDFVILLGDNIYQTGVDSVDDPQFEFKFELPYKDIDVPFHIVLGNHDYGSNGAGLEPQKGKYQVAYSKKSDKWKLPHHYYQYTLNQTAFFALDTQAQLVALDDTQREKVSAWIDASNATWKIAYGHHPYLSNGPHGNAGRYDGLAGVDIVRGENIKTFAEAVWCGKVDVYLSGHDHSRQWLLPTCDGTQLVVSGAGAKVTGLPGNNATRFQASSTGFLYVVIQGGTLNADFIDAHGIVEFSYHLTKP